MVSSSSDISRDPSDLMGIQYDPWLWFKDMNVYTYRQKKSGSDGSANRGRDHTLMVVSNAMRGTVLLSSIDRDDARTTPSHLDFEMTANERRGNEKKKTQDGKGTKHTAHLLLPSIDIGIDTELNETHTHPLRPRLLLGVICLGGPE
ncbi:hypothetical protein PG985_013916 [Apiospora marii]|uniref:Uncharacterized protein n=1 Tax=Apiospora marii TaxID=335849 RepID=A0ABR1R6F9_9PEZI